MVDGTLRARGDTVRALQRASSKDCGNPHRSDPAACDHRQGSRRSPGHAFSLIFVKKTVPPRSDWVHIAGGMMRARQDVNIWRDVPELALTAITLGGSNMK